MPSVLTPTQQSSHAERKVIPKYSRIRVINMKKYYIEKFKIDDPKSIQLASLKYISSIKFIKCHTIMALTNCLLLLLLLVFVCPLHATNEGNIAYQWPTLLSPTTLSNNINSTDAISLTNAMEFGFALSGGGDQYLLVGAPKFSQPTQSTGNVFECPLHKLRNISSPFKDKSELHCKPLSLQVEPTITPLWSQEYRRLGATLAHRATQSLVCAPAAFNEELPNEKYPNGKCWLLNGTRIQDTELISTSVPQSQPEVVVWPLAPFQSINKQIHQQKYYYSDALSGFSAEFDHDWRSLLLGAPGFFEWKGGVVHYDLHAAVLSLNPARNKPGANLYYYRDPLLSSYSYFGFSVGMGQFFSDQQSYAATGAPRYNQTGAVFLFRLNQASRWNGFLYEQRLTQVKFLFGEQFGEFFGASIQCVDLNNDGMTDLVVGAPYHSLSSKERSDNGIVYVYLSTGNYLPITKKLIGREAPDAMFGYSISAVADLNQDSYKDLVIGAPFEEEQKGCVYFYYGSAEGPSSSYGQRICASEQVQTLGMQLRGFGINVFTGSDVDNNLYPDTVVGAHLSDRAIIFRSRPVARVLGELRFSNSSVNLNDVKTCQSGSKRHVCIDLMLCARLYGAHLPAKIRLRTLLRADTNQLGGQSRAFLQPPPRLGNEQQLSTSGHSLQFVATVTAGEQLVCLPPIAVLIKNEIQDKLSPIHFTAAYTLPAESEEARCYDCVQLLDADRSLNASLPFQTGCSQNGVCVATLRLSSQFRTLPTRTDDPEADQNAVGPGPIQLKPLLLGLHRAVRIMLQVQNTGENAYQAQLRLTCEPPLPLQRIESHCTAGDPNTGELFCSLGNPFEQGQMHYSFTFDLTPETVGSFQQLTFRLDLSTSSNVTDPNQLKQQIHVPIKRFASIETRRTRTSTVLFEAGKARNYTLRSFSTLLQFTKDNHSPIRKLQLTLLVPSKVGKDDLVPSFQIENAQHNGMKVNCSSDNKARIGRLLNLLNTTDNYQDDETDDDTDLEDSSEIDQADTKPYENKNRLQSQSAIVSPLILSCETIQCIRYVCDAGPVRAGRQLLQFKVGGELNLMTLERHFERNQSHVELRIKHGIRIMDAGFDPKHNRLADRGVLRLKFESVPLKERIPLWIYATSLVVGLMLLTLIVLALFKMGFFKRSKREEMKKLIEEMNSTRAMQNVSSKPN